MIQAHLLSLPTFFWFVTQSSPLWARKGWQKPKNTSMWGYEIYYKCSWMTSLPNSHYLGHHKIQMDARVHSTREKINRSKLRQYLKNLIRCGHKRKPKVIFLRFCFTLWFCVNFEKHSNHDRCIILIFYKSFLYMSKKFSDWNYHKRLKSENEWECWEKKKKFKAFRLSF